MLQGYVGVLLESDKPAWNRSSKVPFLWNSGIALQMKFVDIQRLELQIFRTARWWRDATVKRHGITIEQ